MNSVQLNFHHYRHLPYERRLAQLEVARLFNVDPIERTGSLYFSTHNRIELSALTRLTYFRDIVVNGTEVVVPQQTLLESSSTRHGDPFQMRRQSTRYSAHGLHEYRGKFNPQIARLAMNLVGLEVEGLVWDPFCGSGTVLLESMHQGLNAVGVDRNPLAVKITNAKISAMQVSQSMLKESAMKTVGRIEKYSDERHMQRLASSEEREDILGKGWIQKFQNSEYLCRWFPLPVLAQVAIIMEAIRELEDATIRGVFQVILSDILRQISWQEPKDLRIRRRKIQAENYPAISEFRLALEKQLDTILPAHKHIVRDSSWQRAFRADSSRIRESSSQVHQFLSSGVDFVLSSPPYVTALPYIDTQRLSIALFGMASVKEIRHLDSTIIGSREISVRQRRFVEDQIDSNTSNLPDSISNLCKALKYAYAPHRDGFRRQNVAAVVYRYFAGMLDVMHSLKYYLKKGGGLAFVLGPSRTSLNDSKFVIDTPTLVAEIGEQVGLNLVEVHTLDTYSRYDVHSRNSIREEKLIVMRNE